jgi:hypothetical protein
MINDQETISWISVSNALPDDDAMVMVCARTTDFPVWLGYYDEGSWFAVEGGVYKKGVVVAWSKLPNGVVP